MERSQLSAVVAPSGTRELVMRAYEARLRTEGSPLAATEIALDQTLRQARAVLSEILCDGAAIDPELTPAIGAARAISGLHPVHSLRAGHVFYEVALPILAAAEGASEPAEQFAGLAARLHRQVSSRIVAGVLAYIDTLVQELSGAHVQERRRVARELHDEVAHDIGVALHALEAWAPEGGSVDDLGATLQRAADMVRTALDDVRRMAGELHRAVEGERLEIAVERFLHSNDAADRAAVAVFGDTLLVPPAYRDELFLTIREALRNSFAHAPGSTITVTLLVQDAMFTAHVADDGPGIGPVPGGLGLASMRERVHLLGGTFRLASSESGTRVSIEVPLAGAAG